MSVDLDELAEGVLHAIAVAVVCMTRLGFVKAHALASGTGHVISAQALDIARGVDSGHLPQFALYNSTTT
jgi:hypothetical protein